jgi:hypothetical protein
MGERWLPDGRRAEAMSANSDKNKALVWEAFDALFNRRDFAAAEDRFPEDREAP